MGAARHMLSRRVNATTAASIAKAALPTAGALAACGVFVASRQQWRSRRVSWRAARRGATQERSGSSAPPGRAARRNPAQDLGGSSPLPGRAARRIVAQEAVKERGLASLDQLGVAANSPLLGSPSGRSWIESSTVLELQPMVVTASVVDCGSGSTRGITLTEKLDVYGRSTTVCRKKSDWRGQPLAVALQGEDRLHGLLDLLEKEIPEGLVLVGATAGVRHALHMGELGAKELNDFAASLQERLGSRASFMVLSGEDEARAEWEAVKYELRIRVGALGSSPMVCAGMISGGGMSCQMAIGGAGDEGPRFLSFENGVLVPGGIVSRTESGQLTFAELCDGLRAHEAAAAEAMADFPRKQQGTFVLIEWVGLFVAGEPTSRDLAMGLGYERLLSRQEVLEAVDEHVASLLHDAEACTHGGVSRSTAVALAYGTVIRALLRHSFGEAAYFYGIRGVNWATGHYLLSKQAMALA